jgi:hypothetical protein
MGVPTGTMGGGRQAQLMLMHVHVSSALRFESCNVQLLDNGL